MFTVSRLASCSSWISILQSTRNAQNILYVLDFQVLLCFALAGNPTSSSTTHTPGTCLRDIIRLPRLRMPGPSIFTPIADTGTQPCLWSMSGIRAAGFSTLTSCQYVLTLQRPTNHWDRGSPPQSIVFWVNLLMIDSPARQLCVWAAVSPATHGFHISCEAIVDINIVPIEFPSINPLPRISASAPYTDGPPGIAFNRTVDSVFVTLGASGPFCCRAVGPGSCPSRTRVPNRLIVLPFDCKETNNAKMWRHGNSAPVLHGRSSSGDQSQGSKMQVLMRCIHSLDLCALAGARSRGYHAWWGIWDHRTCATWSWRCDIWYDMVLFPGSGHLETERLPTKKCRSFPPLNKHCDLKYAFQASKQSIIEAIR